MSRPIADYIALALIGDLDDPQSDFPFGSHGTQEFKGSWTELRKEAEARCEFEISEALLREALRTLSKAGVVRVSNDQFAGEFIKIFPSRFDSLVRLASEEDSRAKAEGDDLGPLIRPSDYPNANALLSHPILDDYAELGDEWLRRALAGIRKQIVDTGSVEQIPFTSNENSAPGSDRRVLFSDNEIRDFDSQTSAIIDSVENLNSIDGVTSFRELILGQLKAGRELIRSGCARVYLLEITLLETLKFLTKRYEHDAIGGLASALAIALAKHLGLDV